MRRGSFQIPKSVWLGRKQIEIAHLPDGGAAADFLTCFIEDEYGLASTNGEIRTILDIGANFGFFSVAARSYFPTALIHAYEPNPRTLVCTAKNAQNAGFELFGEAVGGVSGMVSMDDPADANLARTVYGGNIPQVSLATAVERLNGQVDLAKIDCEGAEWEMFQYPEPWNHIGLVRMEYHLWGKRKFSDLKECLDSLGFKIDLHRTSGEWGTVWAHRIP